MLRIHDKGKAILEFQTLSVKEAKRVLYVLHAFGRKTCSLWNNGTCLVKAPRLRRS